MAKREPDHDRSEQFDLFWREQADNHARRGEVLTCSAVLERELSELIAEQFRALARGRGRLSEEGDEKHWEDELQKLPDQATARARIAFLLGLIDRQTLHALKEFFKLRNKFAHWQIPSPLTDERISVLWNEYRAKRFFRGSISRSTLSPAEKLRTFASHLWTVLVTAKDGISSDSPSKD